MYSELWFINIAKKLMSFNTENRTISDIFQRSCRYVVPRYQRGYVWKEQNWNELLTDIVFTIRVNDADLEWSHFLGTIVLNSHTTNHNYSRVQGITNFEIIDGQQRLTTIYIIFAALYKRLLDIDSVESNKRAQYVYSSFLVSLSADSEKIIVIGNLELDDFIREILDYAGNEVSSINGKNILKKVFEYFYNEFRKYDFVKTIQFLDRLLNINVVEIVSNQEEEIYNIFEVLNARGQKLKQIELLKNHIMKYIQPRESSFIDHTKQKWETIISNTTNLTDQDNLIIHFAKCYIKKNAENSDSVYKLIKEEVKIEDLSKFLEELVVFSDSYKLINERSTDDPVIEYFNIKRNQQIRSLLSAIDILFKRNIISSDSKIITFENIRNFFFWFNASQQTSNKTDSLVSEYAYLVYNSTTEIQFKFVITDFFCKISSLLHEKNLLELLKTNNSFRYSNKNRSFKKNSRLVKYILSNYLNEFQIDTQLDEGNLTIEHLLSDNGSVETSLLSNLTLTSDQINSSILSNKCIYEKIKLLQTQSTIIENKNLEKYYDGETFDFNQRMEDLANTLINSTFKFIASPFNICECQSEVFKKNSSLVQDDDQLMELLLNTGKYFELKLNSNPKLVNERDRYFQLLNEARQ